MVPDVPFAVPFLGVCAEEKRPALGAGVRVKARDAKRSASAEHVLRRRANNLQAV